MRAGRFAEAWAISDLAQQLRADVDCSTWPRHEQFIWRGEPLEGRRVLVRCYHGLGDTLQFVRFLPRVRRMAQEITLWVQPSLMPLLVEGSGADHVIPLHDGDLDIPRDVDVELCELMHVLRVTPDTLVDEIPYLRVARPQANSSCPRPLRAGVVWAAGDWDGSRSIPCAALAPLGAVADIDWLVMQRGPALGQWCHPFGSIPAIDSILDEARILASLDLLITVDTCSAHLAGALGIPVWTLLPHAADWRWMRDRSDTPWYPTMRLFRQPRPGAWGAALREVERELRALAHANA
jgi:hypothetical protein